MHLHFVYRSSTFNGSRMHFSTHIPIESLDITILPGTIQVITNKFSLFACVYTYRWAAVYGRALFVMHHINFNGIHLIDSTFLHAFKTEGEEREREREGGKTGIYRLRRDGVNGNLLNEFCSAIKSQNVITLMRPSVIGAILQIAFVGCDVSK